MPKEKVKRIDSLRHNEYYGMQNTFDELYSESIKAVSYTHLDVYKRQIFGSA